MKIEPTDTLEWEVLFDGCYPEQIQHITALTDAIIAAEDVKDVFPERKVYIDQIVRRRIKTI